MDGLRLLDTAEAMEVCLQELAALEAPSPEEWQQRQELVADHLERLNSNLDGHLGSVTARVFGSSLMGLAMAGSDVGARHVVLGAAAAAQHTVAVLAASSRTGGVH
jgi:hypothetical protein